MYCSYKKIKYVQVTKNISYDASCMAQATDMIMSLIYILPVDWVVVLEQCVHNVAGVVITGAGTDENKAGKADTETKEFSGEDIGTGDIGMDVFDVDACTDGAAVKSIGMDA